MKEIKMTIPQFLAVQRGELNINEINEINRLDNFIGSLSNKAYKCLVFTIASLGFASNRVYGDSGVALNKLDEAGMKILSILQRAGFWVAIIGCITEILVSVFRNGGGQKEILNLLFKWLLIFSSFYIVPSLFRFIVGLFG
ncbi:MAG: hypothetical protein RSA29_02525 [Clostridium sp.]|uniref:hypothetical protein n=1 Tax=Clostridium sp. TaxID=1506 RepID=UPI0030205A11